jgi:hypothetical protein
MGRRRPPPPQVCSRLPAYAAAPLLTGFPPASYLKHQLSGFHVSALGPPQRPQPGSLECAGAARLPNARGRWWRWAGLLRRLGRVCCRVLPPSLGQAMSHKVLGDIGNAWGRRVAGRLQRWRQRRPAASRLRHHSMGDAGCSGVLCEIATQQRRHALLPKLEHAGAVRQAPAGNKEQHARPLPLGGWRCCWPPSAAGIGAFVVVRRLAGCTRSTITIESTGARKELVLADQAQNNRKRAKGYT